MSEPVSPKGNALLVGDSHADSLKPAYAAAAKSESYNAHFMIDSCNPGKKSCDIDTIIDVVEQLKVDKLVLHDMHNKVAYRKTEALIKQLPSSVDVFVVKPISIYEKSIPKRLYNQFMEQTETSMPLTIEQVRERYAKYKPKFASLEKAGAQIIETVDVFCQPACKIQSGDVPLYYDWHHLTITGSLMLEKRLQTQIFQM